MRDLKMSEENQITHSEIVNAHSTLRMRKDGIIELISNDNFVFEVEDVKENYEAIKKLSPNKKALVLNIVGKYASANKSTQEYVAKGPHKDIVLAETFVLRSLAQILLARFYIKLFKPVVKTSFFKNETDAVKWLLKQNK